MRSDTLRPAFAAVVAVAVLGFGAATLSDAVVVTSTPTFGATPTPDLPGGTTGAYAMILLGFGVLTFAVYALDGRGIENKRRVVKAVPILAGIVGLIVVVNYLLFTLIEPSSGFEVYEPAMPGAEDGGGNNSSGDGGSPATGGGNLFGSTALLGALFIAVVTVLFWEYVPRGDDDAPDAAEIVEEADDDGAIGRSAGRAADRIENAEDGVENEVYRAWREMANDVDVGDPRTSTPAEFADAATDAGLDRRRVEELTDLFEAVRYGGRAVTEEREQRAVEALREIEREHGGEEA